MKIRILSWEIIIRRTPPKNASKINGANKSLGRKKIATSGRSALRVGGAA